MSECATEKFDIDSSIRQIRSRMRPKRSSPTQYVAAWSEDDLIQEFSDDKQDLATAKVVPVKAFVIILRTRGCFWALKSGCSMCGYINDSCSGEITDDDIMAQFSAAMQRYKGEAIVKIFNSGSFFDAQEIQREIQQKILKELSGKVKKVALETRVEFVNENDLKEAINSVKPAQLELGIGLESANDAILEKSINKHMKFVDFVRAANIARSLGVLVKTYLLIKPSFLTEREAIEDAVESVRKASPYTTTFSFNPMNVQNFTFVEHLFHRGEYRPPYLWSVAEILRRAKPITNARLQCDPTGGGSRRGAHNCAKCDDAVLADIRRFSLTQNIRALEGIMEIKCECKEEWKDKLEIEKFSGF
jgi:radical SAM enzyme (TIGR01210 family)